MLAPEFQKTMRQTAAASQIIEALWNNIREQYAAPERFYHNLAHLDHIILQLLPVKRQIMNWPAVVLATAYHDIVCNPMRADNEDQCAVRAEQDLSSLVDGATLARCNRMIRATKAHAEGADTDLNFFIDAGLSILGAPPAAYMNDTQQVRKEYRQFPDAVYRSGRKAVIGQFLRRQRIFSTPHFQQLHEAAARRNLKAESGRLEQPA